MSSDLNTEFGLSSVANLFKTKFLSYYENAYNSHTPLFSQLSKTNDFTGTHLEFPVPLTYKGGVGSGRLPETAPATYGQVKILPKKVYAADKVDRESIMASLSSEGAFVKAMSECIKKTVEADLWNHNRILFGKGNGSLGTIDNLGVTDKGDGKYEIIISAATWKEANWEENMFVNVHTGTDKFLIEEVAPSTRTITIQRQGGGTDVPAATNIVYMQGSKDNDPHGLEEVLLATSGTMYNIPVGRRWQAFQKDASGAIGTDLLNHVAVGVERQCGMCPDTGVTSYEQWEQLLNLLEDQKRYSLTSVEPKAANLKGKISFTGVQFMSSRGPINIFPDKFCRPDMFMFLNSKHIKYFRRPNSGWVKDDIGGNGYLRAADDDAFEARLATYGNIYIAPPFQGVLYGLTY